MRAPKGFRPWDIALVHEGGLSGDKEVVIFLCPVCRRISWEYITVKDVSEGCYACQYLIPEGVIS